MSPPRHRQNEELMRKFTDSANVKKILSDPDARINNATDIIKKMAEALEVIFTAATTKNKNRNDLEKLCEIAIAIAPVVASRKKLNAISKLDALLNKEYFDQYLNDKYGIDELVNNFNGLLQRINSSIPDIKNRNFDLLRAEIATCMAHMQQLSTNKTVDTPLAHNHPYDPYDPNKSTALITSALLATPPRNNPVTNATATSSTLRQPDADELRYWFKNKDDARTYVGDLGNHLQDLLNKKDASMEITFMIKTSTNPNDLRINLTSQSVMSEADATKIAEKMSDYFKNLYCHERPTIKVVKSASESKKQNMELFRIEIEPLEVMKAMVLDSINYQFGFGTTNPKDIFARHVKDFPKMDRNGEFTFVCPKDGETIGPKTTAELRQMATKTLEDKLNASKIIEIGSLPRVDKRSDPPPSSFKPS